MVDVFTLWSWSRKDAAELPCTVQGAFTQMTSDHLGDVGDKKV